MPTTTQVQTKDSVAAGVSRSEPVGRAQRNARGRDAGIPPGVADLPERVRELLPDGVVDELLAGAQGEEEIVGPGGLLSQLTKRLVERAMEVELTEHLGYEPHLEPPGGTGNARNGSTPKTLMTEHGPVRIDTPRDRAGTFDPQIVRKRQRRFEGFDEKILALYSRGLSTRDIEAHLAEIYGVKVGRDLISRVTDAVMEDARAWQSRPLEDVYPVVFLDCMVLKIRDGGSVQRKACYLALAIGLDGERDVLGMWFQANEGAKFWMQVLTDLKQRGVQDILITCVDGLKGFPEAIEEEVELLDLDLAGYVLEWHARVPDWRDYYLSLDQTRHYAYMKKVLQALTFLRGPRTWILKSPQHCEQLGPLIATFPDATVAFTHRDPVAVIQSAITMMAYSDRLRRTSIEPGWLLDYWSDRVQRLLGACVRDRELIPAERSIDISFHHLNGNEIPLLDELYRRGGVELTPKVRRRFQRYLDGNPRGKHGSIHYDLQRHFGISPDELRQRFDFYFDRFDVQPE